MAKAQKVFGECRLCKVHSQLVEGHIIPRFFLKRTGLTGAGLKFKIQCFTNPSASEWNRQDGFKEYLMCRECDNERIGGLERYASNQFSRADSPLGKVPSDGYLWTGLDYAQMKLFTISLLWRMSLSSHPWCGPVRLGSHEEQMRQMLLQENPAEPWRYGWSINGLLYGPKPLPPIFSQPQYWEEENVAGFRFVLGGVLCWALVESQRMSTVQSAAVLQRDGTWYIPSHHALGIPFIKAEIDLFRAHGVV